MKALKNAHEAITALAAGADYLQGILFAHPNQTAMPGRSSSPKTCLSACTLNAMGRGLSMPTMRLPGLTEVGSPARPLIEHLICSSMRPTRWRGDDFADATAAFLLACPMRYALM
jgi:hypothetical protein